MIARMDLYDTVRERTRRLLAATAEPLTADDIAAQLDTTRTRVGYVLRELEQQGAATRTRGGSTQRGRLPDHWHARISPSSADAPATADRPARP